MKKYLKLTAGALTLAFGLSTVAAFAQAPATGTDTTSTKKKRSRKAKALRRHVECGSGSLSPLPPLRRLLLPRQRTRPERLAAH